MNRLKITDCPSIDKLKEILNRAYGLRPSQYKVTDFPPDRIIDLNDLDKDMDSRIIVTSNAGAFKGFVSCYPALNGGLMQSFEDMMGVIAEDGITVNLDKEKLKECYERFASGEILENVQIAQGVEAVPGRDAEIAIHFSTPENRPKVVDGKSDFKNIDNIVMVSKGDVLLVKKPATPGSRGITVKGDEVVPIPGKDAVILLGDGATVDETGTIFTATTDGYVDYNGRKLTVSPVYVVKSNVDYSTGNIKFNGSVHIKGDVLPGFKIEAERHILVDGICQDCELTAKENVILRTGIKGSGGSLIDSGGSVILGYCEKSKIRARENVEIKKYAFNCDIMAGNRIDASSGDGIIAGGSIRAFQEVSAKQLGTQGNSAFSIAVGSKYYIENELGRIRKEKIKIGDTLLHVDVALGRFDLGQTKIATHPKIQKMMEVKKNLESLINDLEKKEEKLLMENKAKSPRVKAKGRVFEGLSVTFYDVTTVVKEELESVVFYFDDKFSEVAWISLKNINSIELNDQ